MDLSSRPRELDVLSLTSIVLMYHSILTHIYMCQELIRRLTHRQLLVHRSSGQKFLSVNIVNDEIGKSQEPELATIRKSENPDMQARR